MSKVFDPVRAFFGTWQGWFIAILVTSQLLLPLHYYTVNRDPHDERFAWRMFSPMRMTACQPTFKLDDKPILLAAEFHEAWIEIAKRGRFRVIEEMAAQLCAKHPGSAVTVTMSCNYLGGQQPVEYGGFDMCNVPQL